MEINLSEIAKARACKNCGKDTTEAAYWENKMELQYNPPCLHTHSLKYEGIQYADYGKPAFTLWTCSACSSTVTLKSVEKEIITNLIDKQKCYK